MVWIILVNLVAILSAIIWMYLLLSKNLEMIKFNTMQILRWIEKKEVRVSNDCIVSESIAPSDSYGAFETTVPLNGFPCSTKRKAPEAEESLTRKEKLGRPELGDAKKLWVKGGVSASELGSGYLGSNVSVGDLFPTEEGMFLAQKNRSALLPEGKFKAIIMNSKDKKNIDNLNALRKIEKDTEKKLGPESSIIFGKNGFNFSAVNNRINPQRNKERSVKCLTTGRTFKNQTQAAKFYKISPSTISGYLTGKVKSGGKHPLDKRKLTWAYAEKSAELSKGRQL